MVEKKKKFSEWYTENYDTVRKYAAVVMREGSLAEDIAQDTFLEAWNKFEVLRNHPNVKGWLIKTAYFKVNNLIRKRSRAEQLTFGNGHPEGVWEEQGYRVKELELVLKAWLSMEEKKRFERVFLWGYSAADVAVLEGITENNARVRISRLTKKLSRNIREQSSNML